ncbi:dipeptide epimerase [Heyndrickxia oleronia]|uniref:dipeptide epimerase n=1 Tax=Heyndrickxia oleronia TaxID=38875 RepID=UPI00217DB38B|nr:dipeptide epimerase [Heyndrickxia oleronia]MCI1589970.1 dipeptide epimerase [Heyndrickxia oleronia]MCI1613404.1 dipeptide epimerase [Heyndrickxia oleronia]MCI1744688.1 dipeptide epimerase [Heyndrickxia oleronia]MCI1761353.1 dipeptide epimerase [Heyndrickxia oleronia]
MIIQDLQVNSRKLPLRMPFKTALRIATEIESIEVSLILENGVIGKGAAAPTFVITGDSSEGMEAALIGPIKNALIGLDITLFQTALQRVQSCCVGNPSAKAAADIALHDAYCKLLNLPLHAFLGDKKPLHTCMTIGVDTPEKMASDAIKSVKDGFQILKVKVGANPELDIDRIEAIQEVVDETTKLRLDANQGWKPKQAVWLINEMEKREFNIEFIEQPVVSYDLEGLKFVTERVGVPIMADESLFSAKDTMKLITGRYIDLLNIKLMKCGGISQAWTIASIAETNGVECMIGSMMEPAFSVGAAAHFAAAHPNVKYFDLDAPLWLSEEPDVLKYNGADIQLSDSPGIGVVEN